MQKSGTNQNVSSQQLSQPQSVSKSQHHQDNFGSSQSQTRRVSSSFRQQSIPNDRRNRQTGSQKYDTTSARSRRSETSNAKVTSSLTADQTSAVAEHVSSSHSKFDSRTPSSMFARRKVMAHGETDNSRPLTNHSKRRASEMQKLRSDEAKANESTSQIYVRMKAYWLQWMFVNARLHQSMKRQEDMASYALSAATSHVGSSLEVITSFDFFIVNFVITFCGCIIFSS